jgi:hypothetical protein
MHTYIHTYTYIHTHIHTYIHTYIHKHIHTYIHTHIHTYIYIYIHIHIYTTGWPNGLSLTSLWRLAQVACTWNWLRKAYCNVLWSNDTCVWLHLNSLSWVTRNSKQSKTEKYFALLMHNCHLISLLKCGCQKSSSRPPCIIFIETYALFLPT